MNLPHTQVHGQKSSEPPVRECPQGRATRRRRPMRRRRKHDAEGDEVVLGAAERPMHQRVLVDPAPLSAEAPLSVRCRAPGSRKPSST